MVAAEDPQQHLELDRLGQVHVEARVGRPESIAFFNSFSKSVALNSASKNFLYPVFVFTIRVAGMEPPQLLSIIGQK